MLELKNISKKLGEFNLKDISFTVSEDDYFVLLGESGAGKSILLEIIAGLINADDGQLIKNNIDISNHKIQHRKIGLLFQDYALFPHLSVFENIAYPLKNKGLSSSEKKAVIQDLAQEMNIVDLLKRKPSTLSGGEQQRVALARILALKPEILLLDEPLSSLDVQLKIELRSLLRKLNQKGLSIIHITHDFEETFTLAKHVGIIQDGRMIQSGTVEEVFKNPKSRFVANLRGVKNFYPATLKSQQGQETRIAIINPDLSFLLLSGMENGNGHAMIRDRDITLSDQKLESSASNNFEAKITEIIPSRFGVEVCCDIGVRLSVSVSKESYQKLNLVEEQKIWVSFKASAVKFYKS
ncbi:MAG: ABC transporter ATP-binding protein [Bacteroidetes bacterium]|nr:ABC transporter ATP-binding protein [Bacteroidota bacterium]MBT5528272.1 ABC transporter ATP-binding protein [Cytophagia bacterium]MBT3421979.1 ABC transporter ATP-binding protein [Bacteroidota bacterium]MBT3802132.1 ABC transporter ATP-binding protein [Bacteroidota bacterium]MBT3935631.1 ABC transporter ATP-binding protein [Bacteroidota bacterium]